MAASAAEATYDTKEMTSISSLDVTGEEMKGKKSREKVEIVNNASHLDHDPSFVKDIVETFEDEPSEDEEDAEQDIHRKRHALRRKQVEMTDGIMREHTEQQESSIPSEMKAGQCDDITQSAARDKATTAENEKTRRKLKIPKPAAVSPRKIKLLINPPSAAPKTATQGGESTEEESAYGANMDRLASIPGVYSPKTPTASTKEKKTSPRSAAAAAMTSEDLEICRRLDQEYERALEEREIGYNARYNSVRQSAGFSIAFMAIYMTLGTIFFTKVAGWELHQALFFAIYTITTVGYGSYRLPDSVGFQIYTIFYIFVGIATLTIMVAQVYQCIALEASRAQHSRDKAELLRRSREVMMDSHHGDSFHGSDQVMNVGDSFTHHMTCVDTFFHYCDECKRYLRDTEFGRGISVLFPFAGLILIGAVVVGPIEGWSVVQSLYFAVVSLTTVG